MSALHQVILSNITSEKSTHVAEAHRQFVFRVSNRANKYMITAAVEQLFKVKVSQVCVLLVKGKTRRVGQRMGRRINWKKAYVTLEEGFDIDFAGSP